MKHATQNAQAIEPKTRIGQGARTFGGHMTYLTRAEKLQADDGGSVVKFIRVGDAIVARFVSRDTVKTKMGEAKRLSVEIVETNIEGVEPGPAAIFESGHISQIMEKRKLKIGQGFMLRLCDINRKSRFKQFGFDRLAEIDDCPPADNDEEPPEWLVEGGEPGEEHEPGSDEEETALDRLVKNT